ncbi:MAG TPA: M14 family zinc carboxypeptidase, partial [Ignavibacteriaceae bacterium]|nr:M14 family zinc carboxypeptidase [Ignavibacteriaceae bacterium]
FNYSWNSFRILLFTILLSGNIMAQEKQIAWDLYHSYENFKEKSLTNRRFKHSDIVPLIEQLKNNKIFKVDKVGKSVEGRDIYLISMGSGKTKVFLWSQMHGDEPTATAALFDMFNFFSNDSAFPELKNLILSNLSIYIIPMVNPDGAEEFQRRNIVEIDLNRDVLRQQTPEAKILKEVFDSLKADFGFNFHDQGRDYSAGNSFNPASISFLAPAPDYDKTLTPPRENAMKLIGNLVSVLNEFVPGHIAKYSDDYEPRAFGDNFTKWGTATVLLESGGWRGDREKQFLRKINYIALLSALNSIASGGYANTDLSVYESIPQNEKFMMDLILRNLTVKRDDVEYLIDVGINFDEINVNGAKDFYLKAEIEDVGDLSVFAGYDEFDLSGYSVEPGETKPEQYLSLEELEKIIPAQLYKNGYTNVIMNNANFQDEYSHLPFNIILDEKIIPESKIKPEESPNFIIKKNNKVKFVVVNGFLIDIEKTEDWKGNSIVYRK